MTYASNRSTETATADYDNVFYNKTTTAAIPYVMFYVDTLPVDEFSARIEKCHKYYEAVAKIREMSVASLPLVVLRQQTHTQPVHLLPFKLRCPRLCPPQKWFVKKYRRKKR